MAPTRKNSEDPTDSEQASPEAERQPTILVADDDASIRSLLTELLAAEGYLTVTAKSGTEVMRLARSEPPDLIILDLRMPDLTGIEIMRRLRDEGLALPVLLITAYGTASTAIQAIQLGAYDYIIKPFEIDDVRPTESAASSSTSAWPRKSASCAPASKAAIPPSASSARTRPCRRSTRPIGRVAAIERLGADHRRDRHGQGADRRCHPPVLGLPQGPDGQGQPDAPCPRRWWRASCSATRRARFTGAIAQRKGRFELADKGTIFLDEIGDMSLSTQREALRVLQEKRVRAGRRQRSRSRSTAASWRRPTGT